MIPFSLVLVIFISYLMVRLNPANNLDEEEVNKTFFIRLFIVKLKYIIYTERIK